MLNARVVASVLLVSLVACSSSSSTGDSGPTCGSATCEPAEYCIVRHATPHDSGTCARHGSGCCPSVCQLDSNDVCSEPPPNGGTSSNGGTPPGGGTPPDPWCFYDGRECCAPSAPPVFPYCDAVRWVETCVQTGERTYSCTLE